jgi:aryl-alcohol dehydrogenase-like predicted oxidoreductase
MRYVRLGQSGLRVSRVCLGTMTYGTPTWRPWVLDEEASQPFYERAIEAGINFFDTADMYSLGVSEEVLGRAIQRLTTRDRVVIATKVFFAVRNGPNDRGLSRKHLFDAIDDSLRRLGTDYVDLYQIHRFDPDTPVEETLAALHDIVRSGRARYIGASSMAAWQFSKLQYTADLHGWTRFVSMQNQYSLMQREEEREMFGLLADQGVGSIPWSPLAKGRLARPWGTQTHRADTDPIGRRLFHDSDKPIADAVQQVAEAHSAPMAQIALAWVLKNPVVTAPIVGATRPHHLPDAIAALDIRLTDDEIRTLEEPYTLRQPTGF